MNLTQALEIMKPDPLTLDGLKKAYRKKAMLYHPDHNEHGLEMMKLINAAKSIVLSGPMGVYENKEFAVGTQGVFKAVADSKAFSLAGGGHTISALQEFGLSSKISYVSTAGGALIEFLMGKKLPGVVALETATTKKA